MSLEDLNKEELSKEELSREELSREEFSTDEYSAEEKKIMQALADSAEEISVPQDLLPENILDTIQKRRNVATSTTENVVSINSRNRKMNRKMITRFVASAASIVAVLWVGNTIYQNISSSKNASTGMYINTVTKDATDIVENGKGTLMFAGEQAEESMTADQSLVSVDSGNVNSYEDVYKSVKKVMDQNKKLYIKDREMVLEEAAEANYATNDISTDAMAPSSMNGTISSGSITSQVTKEQENSQTIKDYSKTNVQTKGIDESDIIKTDGTYIYYVNRSLHQVIIYRAEGEKTEKITTFSIGEIGNLSEVYISGDSLIATGSSYRGNKNYVELVKYDLSDRKEPKFVGTFLQEGNGIVTRKVGDIVYLVTTSCPLVKDVKKNDPKTFVPLVNEELLPWKCIYIPEEPKNNVYTVICSVDVSKEPVLKDSAAVLGFDGTFYMGNDSMYLYRAQYEDYAGKAVNDYWNENSKNIHMMTNLRKLPYDAATGEIGAFVEGKVPGQIKDTFAINEYQGYLRMMTTSYEGYSRNNTSNNVFVLDSNLSVVGSIEGLAEGERIYSARYMGDVAYFVTYRETDPLFSMDLSDPTSPKILGALKIPGFSEYLHDYGNGLLLGIGIDYVKGKHGYDEARVKLSMFDVSDPSDVKEVDKVILENVDEAYALYDYKAVMIDSDKNIFGFVTQGYRENVKESYRVFTYQDNGFREVITQPIVGEYGANVRGVYIGNYVYILGENTINSYEMHWTK